MSVNCVWLLVTGGKCVQDPSNNNMMIVELGMTIHVIVYCVYVIFDLIMSLTISMSIYIIHYYYSVLLLYNNTS